MAVGYSNELNIRSAIKFRPFAVKNNSFRLCSHSTISIYHYFNLNINVLLNTVLSDVLGSSKRQRKTKERMNNIKTEY